MSILFTQLNMSNVLYDVQYIPPKESFRRVKKTQKRLNLRLDQLKAFADQYELSIWQCNLVKAVDIDKRNFQDIANAMGCSRQYVNQEYGRIYARVIYLGFTPQ